MRIRRVRADEWRRWRETRLRMLANDPAFFGMRYEDAAREPDTFWRTWTEQAATADARSAFAAEDDDGRWLGVVACHLRIDPAEAQLYSMWVDPAARGRGVARALIQAVGAWGLERGVIDVYLFVQEANAPALRLYERVGFRRTGAREAMPTGRPGFKLLLRASAAALAALDGAGSADP